MRIIILNIRSFIVNNRLMFSLYILIQIIASLVIIFAYGVYMNFTYEQKSEFVEATAITISFKNGDVKLKEIKDVMDSVDINIKNSAKQIMLTSYYSLDDIEHVNSDLISEMQNSLNDGVYNITIPDSKIATIYISTQYDSNTNKYKYSDDLFEVYSEHVVDGEFFSREDYDSQENTICYCRGTENFKWKIGSTIEFCGEKYVVKGRYNTLFDKQPNRIDVTYYNAPDNMKIDKLSYYFDYFVQKETFENVTSLFTERFGNKIEVNSPDDLLKDDNSYYYSISIIAMVFILIAALNFAIYYRYILESRNRSLAIMRIEGQTNKETIKAFLFEFSISSIIIFLICITIYENILYSYLKNIFTYFDYIYSFKSYFVILVLYTVGTSLVIGLMIKRFVKKLPLEQMKL